MKQTRVDQRSTTFWNTKHSFSAKEKDEESGYSYFGARYYDSDISIWLSVDPMASKYPSLTPYNYCANNPVKLVDPNGMEIIIAGAAADEATSQLQNKTNLKITRNTETGKLSYEGKARNSTDRMLKKAIDNKDITANIEADNSNSFTSKSGEKLSSENGGAYGGNEIDANGHVNTYQYVSPKMLADFDKSVGDQIAGTTMLHEVAESYFGGQIAMKTGEFSLNLGVKNPTYNTAHNMANKIALGGKYTEKFFDNGINYKTGQTFEYVVKTVLYSLIGVNSKSNSGDFAFAYITFDSVYL